MSKQQKLYLLLLPIVIVISLLFWFFLRELSLYFTYTDPSNKEKSYSQQPTYEEIQKSKKTTERFLKAFITFDANSPETYLKDGQSLMTYSLYQELTNPQGILRGTAEVKKKKLISIERSESEITDTGIVWTCSVIEEITNQQNQTYQEESLYILHMIHEEQRWKVQEVESSGVFE